MMLAIATLLSAVDSRADEPAGTITLSRDIPGRNAFREAAPGAANKVATAREDVVVASTRQIAAQVPAPRIPSLPDAALDSVSSGNMHANGGLLAPTIPAIGPQAVLDNTVVRATGSAIGGATSVLQGGAISRPLAPLSGTLSSALGAR